MGLRTTRRLPHLLTNRPATRQKLAFAYKALLARTDRHNLPAQLHLTSETARFTVRYLGKVTDSPEQNFGVLLSRIFGPQSLGSHVFELVRVELITLLC